MDRITIYETPAMTVRLGDDGRSAVITFKPHGNLPVTVLLPREGLTRFLAQASAELAQAVQADKA
jgi:hypothetical protein